MNLQANEALKNQISNRFDNVNDLFEAAFDENISDTEFDAILDNQLYQIAQQRFLEGLPLAQSQKALLELEA